jgi:dienelactone hydrolase
VAARRAATARARAQRCAAVVSASKPPRTMLQAFVGAVLLQLASAQFPPSTHQASVFNPARGLHPRGWQRWAPTAPLLRDTMIDEALAHLAERQHELGTLTTRSQWLGRQQAVRSALNESLGRGLPALAFASPQERNAASPLHATITKSYVHPQLNATVEMLHFESRPGFFVTAALWTPSPDAPGLLPDGRRAGVLYAAGHSCQAWRRYDDPDFFVYQFLLLQLVRQGFVVLSYDPPSQGERGMYWTGTADLSGFSNRTSKVGGCEFNLKTGLFTGSSTLEHDYYARQVLLNNITDSSIWLYDGLRAMDYLASRTDLLDPSRVGMAGCSGGGTQTMYLSAFDPRVVASSTACYASDFAVDFTWMSAADGEQRWPSAMPLHLNKADLSVARAPAPTHYCITTNDGCFPAQGGRMALADASRAFVAMGAGANISSTEAEGPHGYMNRTRRGMYALMQRVLQQRARVDPSEDFSLVNHRIEMPHLIATPHGSVVQDLGSKTIFQLNQEWTRENVARLNERRRTGAPFLESLPSIARRISGYRPELPAASKMSPLPEARFLGKVTDGPGWVPDLPSWQERWILQSEGRCGIGLQIHLPHVGPSVGDDAMESGTYPSSMSTTLAVLLSRSASATNASNPYSRDPYAKELVSQALSQGRGVAIVTLCGFGFLADPIQEENPGHSINLRDAEFTPEGGDIAVFNGRSTPGFHAGEITRAIRFLRSLAYVDGIRHVLSVDYTDSALLHELVANPVPMRNATVAIVGGTTFESVASTELYSSPPHIEVPGALAAYDLPDLMAATLHRSAQTMKMQLWNPTDTNGKRLSWAKAQQVYKLAVHEGANVQFSVGNLSAHHVVQQLLTP